jgi:hypothetical protein
MIMRNKARDQKLRERLGEAVLAEVVTYIDAELESLNVTQSSGSLTEDVSGSDGAVPNPGAPEGSD